jgi:hypothetical protein
MKTQIGGTVIQNPRDTIQSWNFSPVKIFLREREGVDEETIVSLDKEYKRYMEIVAQNRHLKLPVSPPVDQFWHTHILFTRDYTNFSHQACGNYIHHQPAITETERLALAPAYKVILKIYEEMFGFPDEEFWPRDCICSSCTGSWDPGIYNVSDLLTA